jgi:hypothetical protein
LPFPTFNRIQMLHPEGNMAFFLTPPTNTQNREGLTFVNCFI